jgi:hypothetical protein
MKYKDATASIVVLRRRHCMPASLAAMLARQTSRTESAHAATDQFSSSLIRQNPVEPGSALGDALSRLSRSHTVRHWSVIWARRVTTREHGDNACSDELPGCQRRVEADREVACPAQRSGPGRRQAPRVNRLYREVKEVLRDLQHARREPKRWCWRGLRRQVWRGCVESEEACQGPTPPRPRCNPQR